MIRLGARLAFGGGREAFWRLLTVAVAVAVGVALLLVALAGMHAVGVQTDRSAWVDNNGAIPLNELTAPPGSAVPNPRLGANGLPLGQPAPPAGTEPLWWLVNSDVFDGQEIVRVDVAPTGPGSPVPPGLTRVPGPGEYAASPALAALLRSTPADQLAHRFGTRQVGTIANSALASPDSLVVVVGHTPAELSQEPYAGTLARIVAIPPTSGPGAENASTSEALLAAGAVALLFPLLLFIGMATRLAAARREQRFAALRLVGATRRQVATVSAVEAVLASLAGAVAGVLLYLVFHPLVATLPLTGVTPFPGDLSVPPVTFPLVVLCVPLAAALAALVALRRVQISPLGVTRRVTPKPPRAWRLLPLLAGIGVLVWRDHAARITNVGPKDIPYFLVGFLLTMFGLMLAGPWLTMAGSRVIAWRARRAGGLLAGRRLSDDPKGAFRAVSGLVLALFVTTVVVATMATLDSDVAASTGNGSSAPGLVVDQFFGFSGADYPSNGAVPEVSNAVQDRLATIPGVRGVALLYNDRDAPRGSSDINFGLGPTGFVSCAHLAKLPALGRCAEGAQVAAITPDFFDIGTAVQPTNEARQADTTWPTAQVSAATLQSLPVNAVLVGTDGKPATIEAVRTELETTFPDLGEPLTMGAVLPANQELVSQGQLLADVIIGASLLIAGCSLLVSVVGGLMDRRRAFSMLRLTGVPLQELRRVVAIEGALPLTAGAVLSVVLALVTADLAFKAEFGASLHPPGVAFYAMVLAGIVAALAVLTATFPILRRMTGPEVARND